MLKRKRVLSVLCGAPLFSDPKCRPSGKLKSTQFCNYTPLSSRFKEDKVVVASQESSGTVISIHKNQPSVLVKMYQDGCSDYRSSTKHYFSGAEHRRNEFTVEVDHPLATVNTFLVPIILLNLPVILKGEKSDHCELDHVQQYYEKLMCQLTMSNSTLMRENQRYQIRFKQLRMLLEDHIDHLNNLYFTLFLNGYNAIQFPDGQTVNLAEFQGTKLKLIRRTSMLPADALSTATDEDLFASPHHNSKNNGSFTDISAIKTFSEGMRAKQNTSSSLSDSHRAARKFLVGRDDDIESYLQWMNGQTTIW
uniref:PX domain-containing protein n=1 Tax=Elaeophora elaphi TaxID=1147741 RepID=A0A0R3RST8_9BILA